MAESELLKAACSTVFRELPLTNIAKWLNERLCRGVSSDGVLEFESSAFWIGLLQSKSGCRFN